MSYLVIGLERVTKNIQMEKRYSLYIKTCSILKETFEKEFSNKLARKIKPTNLRHILALWMVELLKKICYQ